MGTGEASLSLLRKNDPEGFALLMAQETNPTMAERAWVFIPDPANRHRSGIRIECADCSTNAFFAPSSGGRFPPKAAETHFTRDGWTVGKGPRRDFCPACTAKRADKPKASNIVELPKAMSQPAVKSEPRVMSRDDRRVIIAEVKGCYDEEAKRYLDGWHDERVAQTLGAHVPVAWVREVREDYFGEGGSNEQFDELMRRFEAGEAELERVRKVQAAADEGLVKLQKALDEMRPLVRDVRRAVGK